MHFFAYKNPDFFCALICFIVIIWLELMSGYHMFAPQLKIHRWRPKNVLAVVICV